LVSEIIFPIKPLNPSYTLYDLIGRRETASIRIERNSEDLHTALCFSNDGRTLALCTGSKDKGELELIDVPTGRVRAHLQGKDLGKFAGLEFSKDSLALAITETIPNPKDFANDQKLLVLDASTGNPRCVLQDYGEAFHLSFSSDGRKLAAFCHDPTKGFADPRIRVWDLSTSEQLANFEGEGQPEFLPDCQGLAVSRLNSISFCDCVTGKEFAASGHIFPNDVLIPVPGTQF